MGNRCSRQANNSVVNSAGSNTLDPANKASAELVTQDSSISITVSGSRVAKIQQRMIS